jgi:hypothetical protein
MLVAGRWQLPAEAQQQLGSSPACTPINQSVRYLGGGWSQNNTGVFDETQTNVAKRR